MRRLVSLILFLFLAACILDSGFSADPADTGNDELIAQNLSVLSDTSVGGTRGDDSETDTTDFFDSYDSSIVDTESNYVESVIYDAYLFPDAFFESPVNRNDKARFSDSYYDLIASFHLDDKETKLIERIAAQTSNENIYNHMRVLTKEIGSRAVSVAGNKKAREYLQTELNLLGFSYNMGTLKNQGFYANGHYTENVIATLPSENPDAKILIISAHYDSPLEGESAIDNASGVASLLDIVRTLTEAKIAFDMEIQFCFFSSEEIWYGGAFEYIDCLSEEEKARLFGILNMDMTGYADFDALNSLVVCTKPDPSRGDDLPPESNIISRSIVKAYNEMDFFADRFYSPANVGKHDIVPFYKAGITNCATIQWREIDPVNADGGPFDLASPSAIHTPYDTLERFNIDSLYITTRLIIRSILHIVNF